MIHPHPAALQDLLRTDRCPVGETGLDGHLHRCLQSLLPQGILSLHPARARIVAVEALAPDGLLDHFGVAVGRHTIDPGELTGQALPLLPFQIGTQVRQSFQHGVVNIFEVAAHHHQPLVAARAAAGGIIHLQHQQRPVLGTPAGPVIGHGRARKTGADHHRIDLLRQAGRRVARPRVVRQGIGVH